MCIPKKPKMPEMPEPTPVLKPPEQPEKAPDPVTIKKDAQAKKTKRRNPLRIDLAQQSAGSANSGVNL